MVKRGVSKVVPKLRFPEFRSAKSWTTTELRQLSEFVTERVGTTDCTPYTVSSGVGLVSQQEKLGRTIAGNSLKNYVVLQKNDFAYNKSATKAFPQGFIARYVGEDRAAVPNSIFTCFRTNKDVIDSTFLDNLFSTNLHGNWLRNRIAVGARAHGSLNVSDEDLMHLPVPLPAGSSSLTEQQKIADCLTSLDEVIAAQGRKVEALKTHKHGLMQQLFPCEGETRPRLRFPEFKSEWDARPLHKLAEYENGKAYEKDIQDDGRYVVVNSRFISTDGAIRKHSSANYCIAAEGDVLMVLSDLPNGRALAKCFYVESNDEYAVNQRIARLTPTEVHPKFLYYRLNRHANLLAYDDGLNQTHLSKGSVTECPLFVPTDWSEQQRIADCLSSLDTQLAAETNQFAALKTHKQGLMQQLFPTLEAVGA